MKEIRIKNRAIETAEAIKLLSGCEYGVLSTVDNNGQPYGVPLNYVYINNSIYFHCAPEGHKIENIENNPRVSFCVTGKTNVLPAAFTTEYESAVVFGIASTVTGAEKKNALLWLVEKYSPGFIEEGRNYIKRKAAATKVVKITIDHISGKARR